jgi:glycine reductase
VLTFDPPDDMSIEDWDPIVHSATLRVCDYLADKVRCQKPPELDVFDTTPTPGLRGAVWVGNLSSMEITLGPYTKMGTGVYGITRCSAPWLLSFTEVLDGAVSPHTTYPLANNPLVLHMARSHGKDFNFLGCIVQMTNWSAQPEKQAVANRVAYVAKALGADGAVVTTNVRGQRMVETILGIQALEREGVKAIFMTEEEDNEDGSAPPLLTYTPEVAAVVSTGTGGVDVTFPPVDRVIGFLEPPQEWRAARQPIHGRYGVSHLYDFYGFGTQSCVDY